MSNLTRERVIRESMLLNREVISFLEQVRTLRNTLEPDLEAMVAELELSVDLANRFVSDNTMDFRRVEIGLAQLRALKSNISAMIYGDPNAPNQ